MIFDGKAGQYLSLLTTAGTFTSSASMEVYRPDGIRIESSSYVNNSGVVDFVKPLTVNGTYTLVFIPKATETGAVNLGVVSSIQGVLAIDAPTPTLAALKTGQNARYTFNGVTGKSLQLLLTNNTLDDGNTGTNNYTYVYVYKPDGSQLVSTYQYTSDRPGQLLSLPALPVDGTYTVLVRPDNLDEGQVKLHLKSTNSGTALPTDGTATAVTVADQELGYYRFNGVAGKGYGLALKDLAFTPGTNSPNVTAHLYRPDGSLATSCTLYPSSLDCDFAPSYFTVNGAYGLVFVPRYQNSVSFKVQLGKDVGTELKIDAAAPTTATLKAGQNARYTFNGVTGKSLQLLLTNNTIDDGNTGTNNHTYVHVYKPDGGQLASAYQYTSDRPGQVLSLPALPVDGTYTVLVTPDNLDEGQIKLHLKSTNSGTALPTDGTLTAVSVADQEVGYYRFNGVTGKGYGLVLKDLVFTPGTNSPNVMAYLYRPDGSLATSCSLTGSTLDCDFAPSYFTVDGAYGLVFVPRYQNSASFKVQLGKDVGTELKIDAAAPTTATLKAGQNARYKFNGVTGKSLQLLLTNNTIDDGNTGTNNYTYVYVYKPDGSQLVSTYQYTSDRPGQVLSLPALPVDGTYTVLVAPDNLDEGQIKLHLKSTNSGSALPTDGTATAVSVANQELGYHRFTGVAGKGYGLALKDLVFTPGTNSPNVAAYLYRPDGSLATSCSLTANTLDCDFAPSHFTVNGAYGLVFVPRYLNSASFTVQLAKDVGTELKIDAAAPTTATLKAGQNARYTFNGVTGKSLQLLLTNNTLDDGNTGTNNYTYVYVYKPDGNQLVSAYQYTSNRAGEVISLPPLPVDGVYTVLVNPDNLDEGQVKLHLKSANSGAALATDASATSVSVADQELGYYKFTGVAGKGYGLVLKDLVFTPGVNSPSVTAYLYKPDGSQVTYCTFSTAGDCEFGPNYFPVDGTYGLVFVPKFQNSASFTAQLGKDIGTELKIDAAAPTTVTLKAGQNARYTFNGVTGKNLQLLWTNNTLDDGNTGTNNYTYVTIYKPDGYQLTSESQYTSDRAGEVMSLPPLPVDGVYTVLVNPDNLDEGQVKLHLKSANSGTALPTDGTATAVNVADQELGYYKFTGTAGKGYGVALKDLVFTPGTNSPNVTVYLYKPDGSQATYCSFSTAGDCDFGPNYFPVDGTYGLAFVPRFQNSASFKAQLGKDVGSELTIDAAAPTTVTLAAGQNARYTFTGVAGRNLHLLWTNNTLDDGNTGTNNYTYVTIYRPDGSQLTSESQHTSDRAGEVVRLPALPVDGVYTVLVNPDNLDEGQLKLHLKSANSGTVLPTDGTATSVNVADQELGYFQFAGTAGKGYGLALKDLVFTPGVNSPNVTVSLHRPDGSEVTSCSFTPGTDCKFSPSLFTVDGAYGLVFRPKFQNAASFKAVLSKDLSGELAVDAAQPTTITLAAGQNARYTFNGVAGKSLQLLWTNNTLDDGNTGTNNYTYVYVYRPDGSQMAYAYQYTSSRPAEVLSLPVLPVSGTYTVMVVPDNLDEGQVKLHLKSANSGASLPTDGTATAVSVADQAMGYYRFAGVAGKAYGLALKDLVIAPGVNSPSVTVYLYKPDGSQATYCTFYSSQSTCEFGAGYFALSGDYGLAFVPRFQNSAQANAALTAR
ncbi:MAG TPA: hypothetical protein VFY73_12190 [Ideonella sp.]|uniref:hypothetical protein n=1 Tax=Ideonella sp. TaxID=1929293 RepID=UPI002E36B16D|nr:hypothetical protein [Ideonella sp.]HEX5684777.1 hypothetical protein [Ideonella sp.]